ncbi:VWA domain-containing protein [Thermaurantiacus sp.]
MEAPLAGFVKALRAGGVRVSAAETIDAARTVATLGYREKDQLKLALGLVLAKSAGEKAIHDRLFDLYFHHDLPPIPPPAGAAREKEGVDGPNDQAPGNDPADSFVALASGKDPAALALALQHAAAAAGVENIRFETQAGHFARRMLEAMGVEAVEARMMARFAEGTAEAGEEARALIAARQAMQRAARAQVMQRFDVHGRAATENFMEEVLMARPLDQLAQADLARMQRIVARLAKKLADRHGRRLRRRRRGRLDAARTLRRNAGLGGVPFDLVLKTKPRERPRIAAICDVSGSVARHVRFLLLFLHALEAEVADLRLFAFSSRLEDVGHLVAAQEPEAAIAHILRRLGAGATDYGQALRDLVTDHPDSIDRHTTVIILGDGRSNHADPRLDLFSAVAERARRLVWLNPEPPSLWGTGDSEIPAYRPHVSRLEHCRTIGDLERVLDELLDAYG